MLQIENGIQIATDNYYIRHKENGIDELHFEVSIYDPAYRAITEECRILETTEQQTYAVKSIGAGKRTAKIGCKLDLSDWQESICLDYHRTGTPLGLLQGTAVDFLGDSNLISAWTMLDSGNVIEQRTIEMQGPTPLDVALQIQERFGCAVRFKTQDKTATILWPENMPLSNSYVVDTVNLRSAPEFKGKSTDLYTRLYPIGKDGLRIEGDYVENLTYTTQVICAIWKDSRYTDAAELKADAQKRVDAASQPVRSWKLSIVDLHRLNPQKWPDMGVDLFTKLRLVDENKGFSAVVQVKEDNVYPYYPEKNEITASTSTGSVQKTLRSLYQDIHDPNSVFHQKLNAG